MIFTTRPCYVTLINSYGTDDTIVNAAVVADFLYGRNVAHDKHERLMAEMIQSGHWGCLDHCFATFKLEVPIFVARQIMRASNMNFNEKSMRYLTAEPRCYIPEEFHTDVKRRDLGEAPETLGPSSTEAATIAYKDACELSFNAYETMLALGVRKEQARGALPVSMFTEFWMSGRLSDWLHFLNLRTDKHAQYETRIAAMAILGELSQIYPRTIHLWVEYGKGPINAAGTIQTP